MEIVEQLVKRIEQLEIRVKELEDYINELEERKDNEWSDMGW